MSTKKLIAAQNKVAEILRERNERVIKLRGEMKKNGRHKHSMNEIGKMVGITRARVCQILKNQSEQ